ncbi:MAG: helix-turn-helix domain-containing protein [Actinomycetes bacterium]
MGQRSRGPAALARQSRTLLPAAGGVSNGEIAERLGVSRSTAIAWHKRYAGEGLTHSGRSRRGEVS